MNLLKMLQESGVELPKDITYHIPFCDFHKNKDKCSCGAKLWNLANTQWRALLEKVEVDIKKTENKLMYDFPKHYNNGQIIAYQNDLKKLAHALSIQPILRVKK